MANIFNSIPLRAPKLNAFDLSHDVKLTCEMGQLVPIFCEPVLPSDRFKVSSEHLVRFAPLQSPIMSNVDVYVHFFFVPNRIIWPNWETFITGAENGNKLAEEDVPTPPFLTFATSAANMQPAKVLGVGTGSFSFYGGQTGRPLLQNGNLADYLGFQTYTSSELASIANNSGLGSLGYEIDELPFRAYQRIWFDYYRDENLSDAHNFFNTSSTGVGLDDGFIFNHDGFLKVADQNMVNEVSGLMSLRQRAWRKDYFTSALPWAQKGDDVLIPSNISGSLSRSGAATADFSLPNQKGFMVNNSGILSSSTAILASEGSGGSGNSSELVMTSPSGTRSQVSLNLSNFGIDVADESTIRELRRAYAAQAFLERRAVGGSRYNEQILSFFGVKTSDGRLQRAEFLGGSKQPVVVSQVLQTSESTENSPLGEPAGTAVSAGGKFIFDRQFEEYGFVVGIMSVIPRADYMQGVPRKYLKKDVYDYYWPQFARIGEQEIKNQELYMDWGSINNDSVFGYTPRYSEYRFINNRIHGDFKGTLDYWHLGRDFDSTQVLNENFITCRPSRRIFAYDGNDFNHLWVDIHVRCKALRPIPKYAESI